MEIRIRLECVEWFRKQCAEPHKKFWVYYDGQGGVFIAGEQPANLSYKLAMREPLSAGLTVEQAQRKLMEVFYV